MDCTFARALVVVSVMLGSAGSAVAQTPQTPPPPPQPDSQAPPRPTNPAEIELNTINLPTTLSLGRHKSYFRLTHRFARDLRRGGFEEAAASLFGLDDGAVIGVEYRFGIFSNLQAGVHRSLLNKTIETFGRWDPVKQHEGMPVSLSVSVTFEGLDNLRNRHQPGFSATVSHTMSDRLALYVTPTYVAKTHDADLIVGHHDDLPAGEHANHHDTSYLGLGARLRFSPTGYVVGEYSPRMSGYDPNADTWTVGVEKWTRRGHTLMLNFGNSFGTTPGQIARGGNEGQIFLGFNITRKF